MVVAFFVGGWMTLICLYKWNYIREGRILINVNLKILDFWKSIEEKVGCQKLIY